MPAEYIPRVVVKFLDKLIPRRPNAAAEFLAHLITGREWGAIVAHNQDITIRRLFAELNEARLLELMGIAQRREPNYRSPNFLTYFAVPCPSPVDPQAVANALSSWPTVQTAYVEGGPVEPPAINPNNEPYYEIANSSHPYWPGQRYLGGDGNIDLSGTIYKVSGIYVEDAWAEAGGDGATPQSDLQFIDLEQGWNLNHEDLQNVGITMLVPGISKAFFGHGTSDLGIVVAEDNTLGCVGIAPHVASKRVVSEWRDTATFSTSKAIAAAVDVLHFGDVLLLEAQTHYPWMTPIYSNVPVEVYSATFDIIRLGSALGIIIVEAAGNGGYRLDDLIYPTKGRDSGAILVGAASLTDPHYRYDQQRHSGRVGYTNYGSRIDCYAWGENIVTLGDGAAGTGNSEYTAGFGLTSGASAIIAGAALSVQGIAANNGYRLGPRQMRTILSDPATGTTSENPGVDQIGVMPNLQNTVPVVLNLVPDVYIRDFVGDIGDSHNGIIAASPDIILRPLPLIDPLIDTALYNLDPPAAIDEAFGSLSGTENDPTLSIRAKLGDDHAIYVRVKNRGPVDATNVTATVYWSEPSTLLTPNTWRPAGGLSIVIPLVPAAGNGLIVSPAIIWPGNQILVTGHYCFVALIGNAEDPAPDPLDFGSWVNYERFIRENNNVSWRNFDVVDYLLGAPSGPINLRFYIRGPWDKARDMSLEVISTLPAKARLTVQVPIHQKDVLKGLGSVEMDEHQKFVRVSLNPHGMSKAKPFKFPKDFCAEAHLLVHLPEEFRHDTYDIYLRQLYEGREIGRITWRLRPSNQPRVPDGV